MDEVGSLPAPVLNDLLRKMRWTRDTIVFHCYCYEDVLKLPAMDPAAKTSAPTMQEPAVQEPTTPQPAAPPPSSSAPKSAPASAPAATEPPRATTETAPPPAEEPAGNGTLHRGQHLKIKFGDKLWEAVYWGKDNQGSVVAHRTYDHWSLMHLDIERFGNDLAAGDEVDMGLLKEIEQSLATQV